MSDLSRAGIWVRFMAAALVRRDIQTVAQAAGIADKATEEFSQRFEWYWDDAEAFWRPKPKPQA